MPLLPGPDRLRTPVHQVTAPLLAGFPGSFVSVASAGECRPSEGRRSVQISFRSLQNGGGNMTLLVEQRAKLPFDASSCDLAGAAGSIGGPFLFVPINRAGGLRHSGRAGGTHARAIRGPPPSPPAPAAPPPRPPRPPAPLPAPRRQPPRALPRSGPAA